jgi:hypothetical protein
MGGMRMVRALAALAALLLLLCCEPTDILKAVRLANGMTAEGIPVYRVSVTHRAVVYSSMAEDQDRGHFYIAWRDNEGKAWIAHSADSGETWPVTAYMPIDTTTGPKNGRIQIISPMTGKIAACYVSATDLTKLRCSLSSDHGSTWTPNVDVPSINLNSDGSSDFSMTSANATMYLVSNVNTNSLVSYYLPSWLPTAWTPYPAVNVVAAGGQELFGHGNSMAAEQDNSFLLAGFIDPSGSGAYHVAKLPLPPGVWDAHGTVQSRDPIRASSRSAMAINSGITYYVCAFEPDHTIWLHYATDIQGSSTNGGPVYTGTGMIDPVFVGSPGGDVYISFYDDGSKSLMFIWSHDGGATWPAANKATIAQNIGSSEFGFLLSTNYVSFCYYGTTNGEGTPDQLIYARMNTADLP